MLRAATTRARAFGCRQALSDPPSSIARNLWMGSSRPTKWSSFDGAEHDLSRTVSRQLQRRGYLFLPASLSDASKQLKSLFETNQRSHKRLMVRLQNRWQDTLFNVQERIQLLRKIQRKQRTLARQSARSVMRRSANYSRFVRNMRGRVGKLSSVALSQGKRHLLSHYNAKRRVYARRKLARQLARKMGGNRTLIGVEAWTSNRDLEDDGRGSTGANATDATPGDGADADAVGRTTWRGVTLTEPSQRSWFDEEGYPLASRDPETGRFVNPWLSESTNGAHGLEKFLRWKLGGARRRFLEAIGVPSDDGDALGGAKRNAPCVGDSIGGEARDAPIRTDSTETSVSHRAPALSDAGDAINLTWIGHSSTLVSFPGGFTILTDPHFSNYAGPVRRNAPPAFGVADLPDVVDCVLISHDHMDHLDYWSILELIEAEKVKFWIVPLGLKSWLMDKAGVTPEDIIELEWWEEVRISRALESQDSANESGTSLPEVEGLAHAYKATGRYRITREQKPYGMPHKNELVITCAPAQHWCSRTPFDRNRRLWCSFAVYATPAQSKTHSFYFAGDTGVPSEFPLHQQIGDRLGPFDLSAIPIGAYEPEWFMRESHCNPAEAVKIHQAIRSRRSVAIHFDTFDLADEPREEPPKLLLNEVVAVNKKIRKMAAEVVAATVEENKQFVDMLPPLVDFAVIKRGQIIGSLPK